VESFLPDIRIVIVDDDEALRDALEGVLKTAGLHAGKFSTAEEFLESPALQTASCLILDVRLPRMSGIELQHLIREMRNAVPIIFLTAHGDAQIRDLVMSAGAFRLSDQACSSQSPPANGLRCNSNERRLARCELEGITTGTGHC
jgi:FixJ family two-component response regulator